MEPNHTSNLRAATCVADGFKDTPLSDVVFTTHLQTQMLGVLDRAFPIAAYPAFAITLAHESAPLY